MHIWIYDLHLAHSGAHPWGTAHRQLQLLSEVAYATMASLHYSIIRFRMELSVVANVFLWATDICTVHRIFFLLINIMTTVALIDIVATDKCREIQFCAGRKTLPSHLPYEYWYTMANIPTKYDTNTHNRFRILSSIYHYITGNHNMSLHKMWRLEILNIDCI